MVRLAGYRAIELLRAIGPDGALVIWRTRRRRLCRRVRWCHRTRPLRPSALTRLSLLTLDSRDFLAPPRSWRVPSSRLLFARRSLALVVFEPRLHELVEFLHLFVGVGFWRAVFQPTEHVSFD